MPLSLRPNLPIGIPGGLVSLKAPYKLPAAVAMLRELCSEGGHPGFGFQVGIGEQHRHAPVTKPLLLPQLALSPTLGDGNHLRFWGTLLHKDISSRVTITRRYHGSGPRGSLGNDLIMQRLRRADNDLTRWSRWGPGHLGAWGTRWSEDWSVIDRVKIMRPWS